MKRNKSYINVFGFVLCALLIAGCSEGNEEPNDDGTADSGTTTSGGSGTPGQIDGNYNLSLPNQTINITEGSEATATIRVQRNNGYTGQVTVGAENQSQVDTNAIELSITNDTILSSQNSTTLSLKLDISALPIQPEERVVRIIATDGTLQRSVSLTVNVQPTTQPDVYLLVGQSNMVGFSEDGAKQADAGGADERNDRIKQLNVTGNDQENFKTAASFIDVDAIAVPSPRLTPAIDPLHNGYDSGIDGKGGTRIGLGLSFAKDAVKNTQASAIYLVPAAWADTGFCRRDRPESLKAFEGDLGWNATQTLDPVLSGTLLHDRAIARANLALLETEGILRGILWHQGEADGESMACAQLYEQNLIKLVASLRTNINPDARGSAARGENANVPFVVGTMSKGFPYDNPSDSRRKVDEIHRKISQIVRHSALVNNDDLIPTDYPCGEGNCIHFGSRAYRLMGTRYYLGIRDAAIRD